MSSYVKIYVRNVLWTSKHIPTDKSYFDIALYSPSDCLQGEEEPNADIGFDLLRVSIQTKSEDAFDLYTYVRYTKMTREIRIDDPDIYIWDDKSLRRISNIPKEYRKNRDDIGAVRDRFEILDL